MKAAAITTSGGILTEKQTTRSGLLNILISGVAVISFVSVIVGCLTLAFNSVDIYLIPLFYVLSISLFVLFFAARRQQKNQYIILILAMISLLSAIMVSIIPAYWVGLDIHAIIHRSFISGLLMVVISVPGLCYAIYHWMGAAPHAFDVSRYPLLVLPTLLALCAFGLIVVYIVYNGSQHLSWSLLDNPFTSQFHIIETWQNGWPVFTNVSVVQAGMLNHILGTFLLMGLTTLISLPIGVGVGIYVHQYAGSKMAGVIGFSTTALRSISGIILIVTAMSLLKVPAPGTFIYKLFHGYGIDINGVLQVGRSSFIFASAFISLLVIPLIARSTQEGLSSLPKEIYEGSLSVGASEEHTLFHIQIPWSMPNIITGLLLGCAEASGALTIIFLIAGTGQYGVSPLNETTSLAYLIFDCRYGRSFGDAVQNVMGSDQYTAALMLLIITLGLTAAAMIMKKNLAKRYKGA
jgi:ABC-type phosphate transport system permease subunit